MDKRKVIICTGLQRSGNHTVLSWVRALFPETSFHNDQPHDLFADAAALRATLEADPAPVTLFSFEDSANRTPVRGQLLRDSLVPFPAEAFPDCSLHRLVILRDPYNTWASRVAANARADEFGRKLTSDPSWTLFRDNWLGMAARAEDPDWQVILFNRWKDDAAYRRAICDRLGGTYTEATLDQVPEQGGGSSFDGVPRPGFRQMLAQWPKYVSGPFLRRLTMKPGHYVKRLLTPPPTGRDLKVDQRWTTLTDRPDSAPLFADAELRAATARLFGATAVPPVAAAEAAAARTGSAA